MAHPVKITAILTAKPGKTEALTALLAGMVAPCRAEPGNLRWDIWQDQADPNRFVLDELYTDNMALKDILPGKLGFGAAPLGNMFRDIPEDEALATVDAAWNDGIRYYDNAPFYGAGLAEIRMGEALAEPPRDRTM
jgi:hypothetical protein